MNLVVVIVAPHDGFRRSLEFALEAEGFFIESHALLTAALESPLAMSAACAVIDEDAIRDQSGLPEMLDRFGTPVILLVDRLRRLPGTGRVSALTKPLLGNALIDAVRGIAAASPL